MVTPLYGQSKTLGQNNYIPMITEHLTEKHTKAKITVFKKMHFIEMPHIEITVAKPAATTQIRLKFGGQMVGYDFSNTEVVSIHQKKKGGGL